MLGFECSSLPDFSRSEECGESRVTIRERSHQQQYPQKRKEENRAVAKLKKQLAKLQSQMAEMQKQNRHFQDEIGELRLSEGLSVKDGCRLSTCIS